jgi:hypothetical protein
LEIPTSDSMKFILPVVVLIVLCFILPCIEYKRNKGKSNLIAEVQSDFEYGLLPSWSSFTKSMGVQKIMEKQKEEVLAKRAKTLIGHAMS